jgi:hypothetical protein
MFEKHDLMFFSRQYHQVGYGDTSDNGEVSNILLEVTVDTFADTFCDTLYRDYDPSIMLCAGTEGTTRYDPFSPILSMFCSPMLCL